MTQLATETAIVFVLIATVVFWFRVLVLNVAWIPYDVQEWHYPQLAFLGL